LTETAETAQPANVGFTVPNGPFIVTGDLQIDIADAEPLTQPRASLCRCGASAKKPFCDGSHRTSGWLEPGEAAPAENLGESGSPGRVVFVPIPNGPLLANGPLTIQNAQKQTIANTTETALCRCGASANKPYCDGSHSAIGFQA
jgi:CDGSH-type Zn-finger protein